MAHLERKKGHPPRDYSCLCDDRTATVGEQCKSSPTSLKLRASSIRYHLAAGEPRPAGIFERGQGERDAVLRVLSSPNADGVLCPTQMREVRVFTSHEEARQAERAELAAMTKEQRLAVGAELHEFWVRNYFPDATRLDRTVQVVQRARR